ncbi:MAG: DUF3261 domain-containing protein [Treponema sp.]|nr:DUF3261 domain-containing protein [Treponema sp.]
MTIDKYYNPSYSIRHMRGMKVLLFFFVSFACVISCKSVAKKDSLGSDSLYVDITDSSKFVLLPTGGIVGAMDMVQFLSFEYGGQVYFFNAWVKANDNEIEMAFFNELGKSMGELSYRNGSANFSSPIFQRFIIQFIKPEYIIADFQFCFYDPILLARSLKDIGLVLEASENSRRIFSGNEVIIEIEKTNNAVKLVNNLRGYIYTLEGDFN